MNRFFSGGVFICLCIIIHQQGAANDGPFLPGPADKKIFVVRSPMMELHVNADGEVIALRSSSSKRWQLISGRSSIAGCHALGDTKSSRGEDGSISFQRRLINDSLGASCLFTQTFIPAANSIRWEIRIKGDGKPWSQPIQTALHYPAGSDASFWAPWGAPQYDSSDVSLVTLLNPVVTGSANIKNMPAGSEKDLWIDPLIPVPFADAEYFYGAPPFTYQRPIPGFCPFPGNLLSIPLFTFMDDKYGTGITLALSPSDDLIDLTLRTTKQGEAMFERLSNKISGDRELVFSADIILHQNDWRPALAWISDRYPDYFLPSDADALQLAGTGAYSNHYDMDADMEKMKRMCFTVNWMASFDFPYMGMFLPPVSLREPWKRFGKGHMTIDSLNNYAGRMRSAGFHALNYFNVTEFGAAIRDTVIGHPSSGDASLWKNSQQFLYSAFPGAVLRIPLKTTFASGDDRYPGEPWFTWENAVAMDCGDTAYKNFLLQQAVRHIREMPNSSGICIDRLDWLRMYNEQYSDDSTWFDGRPARSLVHSFKALMKELDPLMHAAGKNILVNNHTKRIDLLKGVDGIFDEFTYGGSPLNTTAFLCMFKPALGWTDNGETIKQEGVDLFFQKYLYMGVFPMCPFPGNDHSLFPDPEIDRLYEDYSELMKQMQGRVWALKPKMVAVKDKLAKANIFKKDNGYVIPVVYGSPGASSVTVLLNDVSLRGKKLNCRAFYPGTAKPVAIKHNWKKNRLVLKASLVRGCAMLSVIPE